jgi:hypothetical protein
LGGQRKTILRRTEPGSHLKECNRPCSTLYPKGVRYAEPHRRCVLAKLQRDPHSGGSPVIPRLQVLAASLRAQEARSYRRLNRRKTRGRLKKAASYNNRRQKYNPVLRYCLKPESARSPIRKSFQPPGALVVKRVVRLAPLQNQPVAYLVDSLTSNLSGKVQLPSPPCHLLCVHVSTWAQTIRDKIITNRSRAVK